MGMAEILVAYREYGVAGLFIILYVITTRQFYLELKSSKDDVVRMTEKYATALDQATTAVNRSTTTMELVKGGLEESRRQTSEFIAFTKGRDSGKGN